MKNITMLWVAFIAITFASCTEKPAEVVVAEDWQPADSTAAPEQVIDDTGFIWQTEQFADIKILQYQIPGWDKLTPKQKELVYYLTEAGLAGRDIMYDQNYRHNLKIRRGLEKIYTAFEGDKNTKGWKNFEIYLKRVWFSNGIHHHYSNAKILPDFSREYFNEIATATGTELSNEVLEAIFNPDVDNKKVEQDPAKGLVEGSAINFYAPNVTTADAEAYYGSIVQENPRSPVSVGINSKLVKDENGVVSERVYRVGEMYSAALERVIFWLNKAESVAENDKQASALRKLIQYYETGDLKIWDLYNIAWTSATEGDIDYINGFVEVYNDPLGYTGTYENIVQIKDFDASERMKVLMENAQWFETNSPFMDQHKKEKVVGITYNVVNVAGEAGDASPSTPIGVNLPNADWIRAVHGSKSVSLGNIVDAYDKASGTGMLALFAHDEEEIELAKKHGELAGSLHTALHEVIGHASGKLEEGVGSPKETIKNYASTLEEGRADLLALYFVMDQKLVDIGIMETLDVGRAEYDGYIRNGLLAQLRRLNVGDNIEEAHMRNRAWVSRWALEKGKADNVIEEVEREGNLYYNITDYEKLRAIFGELLREVQRIKSQGDYEAAKNLVENYGVKVDPKVHQQVLDRAATLNSAPYGGFINPRLVPVMDEAGNMSDVKVEFVNDFTKQMLEYSQKYSILPDEN